MIVFLINMGMSNVNGYIKFSHCLNSVKQWLVIHSEYLNFDTMLLHIIKPSIHAVHFMSYCSPLYRSRNPFPSPPEFVTASLVAQNPAAGFLIAFAIILVASLILQPIVPCIAQSVFLQSFRSSEMCRCLFRLTIFASRKKNALLHQTILAKCSAA